MEKHEQGAWIVHHVNKLESVTSINGYERLFVSGKAAKIMSFLIDDFSKHRIVSRTRLATLASLANINTILELPIILQHLETHGYIQTDKENVFPLGLTSKGILEHTADLLELLGGEKHEFASIEISNKIAIRPEESKILLEQISDEYSFSAKEMSFFENDVEQFGFVDYQEVSDSKIYFNGNIFRNGNMAKTKRILSALSDAEQRSLSEVDTLLDKIGCLDLLKVQTILGEKLLSKLNSISYYDINQVSNSIDRKVFITKPSSFNLYGSSFTEDVFDLAKKFVTSLYYGMTHSSASRGKIWGVSLILKKLISGGIVGPARAIGEDYKVLEQSGVVEVISDGKGNFTMKLLRKDIGEIALKVLEQGSASDNVILPSSSVSLYVGPEVNREITRKKYNTNTDHKTTDLIESLRQKR